MIRRITLLSTLLVSLASVASAGDAARKIPTDSLFSRLGGTARVAAFVDATVNAAQPGAAPARREEIKADLVAHICAVTGGGCREVRNAQSALRAGSGLLEALRVAMRTHGVPLAARNELLEALAPTHELAHLRQSPRSP